MTCNYIANLLVSIKFVVQEKIVKKLASFDQQEQECGKKLADEMLKQGVKKEIYGDGEIKVKTDRSIINKYPSKEHDSNNDPNQMSRGTFIHVLCYCLVYLASKL